MSKTMTPPREGFDPAYPTPPKVSDPSLSGLTKREHIAALILPAFIPFVITAQGRLPEGAGEVAADAAVQFADMLLARLQS